MARNPILQLSGICTTLRSEECYFCVLNNVAAIGARKATHEFIGYWTEISLFNRIKPGNGGLFPLLIVQGAPVSVTLGKLEVDDRRYI
jgi:hypothetical protein